MLAGPNGAGKTTYATRVLLPQTGLRFVNADLIAAERWPGEEVAHGYDASEVAAQTREALMAARRSFVTETVFSHPSKVDLVVAARAAGYQVNLRVVMVPEELSVARVAYRVAEGGHAVPEAKVRARWHRLWPLAAEAILLMDDAVVLDSSTGGRFVPIARFRNGRVVGTPQWPSWTPSPLTDLTAQPPLP